MQAIFKNYTPKIKGTSYTELNFWCQIAMHATQIFSEIKKGIPTTNWHSQEYLEWKQLTKKLITLNTMISLTAMKGKETQN